MHIVIPVHSSLDFRYPLQASRQIPVNLMELLQQTLLVFQELRVGSICVAFFFSLISVEHLVTEQRNAGSWTATYPDLLNNTDQDTTTRYKG